MEGLSWQWAALIVRGREQRKEEEHGCLDCSRGWVPVQRVHERFAGLDAQPDYTSLSPLAPSPATPLSLFLSLFAKRDK